MIYGNSYSKLVWSPVSKLELNDNIKCHCEERKRRGNLMLCNASLSLLKMEIASSARRSGTPRNDWFVS